MPSSQQSSQVHESLIPSFSSLKTDGEMTLCSVDKNDNNTDSDSTIMTQNNES